MVRTNSRKMEREMGTEQICKSCPASGRPALGFASTVESTGAYQGLEGPGADLGAQEPSGR